MVLSTRILSVVDLYHSLGLVDVEFGDEFIVVAFFEKPGRKNEICLLRLREFQWVS